MSKGFVSYSKYTYFILAIFCCLSTAYSNPFDLFKRIIQDNKVGLVNVQTNEVIVSPQFEDIGWTDGSLSVIHRTIGYRENGKWGLLSLDDTKITQATFTEITPFQNNTIIAAKRDPLSILSKYGVINTKGKMVIPFDYEKIIPFGGLLIMAQKKGNQYLYGLVTQQSKVLIPISYQAIIPVNAQLLAVKNDQGLSAIFDKSGHKLSPFAFESVRPFQKSLLEVTYFGRKGLINETGEVKLPPIYKKVERIPPNRIRTETFNRWILLDRNNQGVRTYFSDKITPIDKGTLAIQAEKKAGIITIDENYLGYHEGVEIVQSKNSLTIVKKNDAYGLLNNRGELTLPIFYDSIVIEKHFVKGKINRLDGQSWDVFDLTGKKKNQIGFEAFHLTGTNRIAARKQGKWGLLNLFGENKSPFLYDSVLSINHELAVVQYQGNYGVINTKGNWVVTPYKDTIHITDHHIFYRQGSENGVMDLKGNILYKSYQAILPNDRGFISKDKKGQSHVYNASADLLTPSGYDSAYLLSKGLYLLLKNESQYLLSAEEKHIQPLKQPVEEVVSVKKGLVGAKIDGKYGFVNTKGQLRVANRYDSIRYFSEGLCAVKLIGKWGFINMEEIIVIQPSYDHTSPFQNGLAIVSHQGKYGLINTDGKTVLETAYDSIVNKNNHFLVLTGDLYGIADQKGQMVRTPQFDTVFLLVKTTFWYPKVDNTESFL